MLGDEAPPRFAGPKYYALLKERMEEATSGKAASQQTIDKSERSDSAGSRQTNGKTEGSGPAYVSCASSSAGLTGIDMILSGQAFAPAHHEAEALVYKSASAILQSSEDGGRCNFQGVLVACDDNPRDVTYPENSHRKRKAGTGEGKATDAIFADKTGPICVCFWGDVAEEICGIWRNLQERLSSGNGEPVELVS